MNSEEFITSGMLELYAAGGLSPEEKLEVEQMAEQSAEVKAALLEACQTMESYASLHAVQPRPSVKDKIMEQISQQDTVSESIVEEENVRSLYPDVEQEGSPYKWMFAASVALFLISGFMSLSFYRKWQDAEQRLAVAQASEQQMAQNINTASYRLDQQDLMLSVMRDSDYMPVKLQGVEAHPDAKVMVYWNTAKQEVYVDVVQLPSPPAGKQYQLWALDNGKPVDAGMISMDKSKKNLMHQMKAIGSAQAFAITLEPAGGSVNPTLEEMYVMGEINS